MQSADKLRDDEIEIGIALAMPVRAHVDRHVLERDVDIGAVIEVEAAQGNTGWPCPLRCAAWRSIRARPRALRRPGIAAVPRSLYP